MPVSEQTPPVVHRRPVNPLLTRGIAPGSLPERRGRPLLPHKGSTCCGEHGGRGGHRL